MTPPRTAIAAVLVAAGCARPASRSASLAFRDPEGHPVTFTSLPVHRIVSTMQSETEWLVALGAAGSLVARTDFDRQPELASLPSIGGGLDPSPEAVAALKPDVILGWKSRASVDLEHSLATFHIPVVSFETTDTADVFRNLAELGVLVGRERKADSLASALRSSLAAAHRDACPSASDSAQTVLLVLWTDPPMTSGGGTWMNTVLDAACLRNVFADLPQPWPTVSLEAITARQPQWLLVSAGEPGQRLAELRATPGWRNLDAVKAGRLLEIPGDLLARPGPTMADAARAIVAARRAH